MTSFDPLGCFFHPDITEIEGYLRCLECGHWYATECELVETDRRMWPAEFGPYEPKPADEIYVCPLCAHDL